MQQLEPMRPWLAGLTMAAAQLAAHGGDPKFGVEHILNAEAKSQGKAIGYLETDADQIQFLSGLSEKAEIFFFEDGLRAIIEEPDLLEGLISSWVSGDVNGVDAAMVYSLQGHQELYAALLVNRNKKWAAQIKTILDGSGTVFIAVGAAHLAGGNSVQYYLGDYGLSAQRTDQCCGKKRPAKRVPASYANTIKKAAQRPPFNTQNCVLPSSSLSYHSSQPVL
ncbi:MAG: TraB/GumN family protein [Kordiimonadaceae bacterium]|nr:TraB/GumN family protein [Kordiimonadaceae bacterium]